MITEVFRLDEGFASPTYKWSPSKELVRMHLAGLAMQAMCTRSGAPATNVAEVAVRFADALMLELELPPT